MVMILSKSVDVAFCMESIGNETGPFAIDGPPIPHVPLEIPIPEGGDVNQDQFWSDLDKNQLAKLKKVLKAHERIASHIEELRLEEKMRLPGGFQTERIVDMLEETYGPDALIEIEKEIRRKGLNSLFYRETKTIFDYFRRNQITEALLRKEWQGRGNQE